MVTERSRLNSKWWNEYSEELQENFVGYFDKTTVHGLRYLTEPRRPWPEKVLWFIGITVSLIACVWLMYKTCIRWVDSPVIIAMDESQRAVWQIPFPAVTVCPQAKINGFLNLKEFAYKYSRGELSKDQEELLTQVQILCKIPIVRYNTRNINYSDPTDAIEFHALDEDEVISSAYLQYREANFEPILTEEGLCYSFNMMPAANFFREGTFHARRNKYLNYNITRVQWNPSLGYEEGSGKTAYPLRALGAGKDPGLQLNLHTRTKYLQSVCDILGQGFQVHLHSPIEFPQLGMQSIYVPLDSVVQLSVHPLETRTNQKLRDSYTSDKRQCYFPNEKYLMYFQHYTQNNCELECLTNVTLEECGCVEFYMPRMPNTRVCGMDKKICAKEQAALLNEMAAGMLPEVPENRKHNRDNHPCGCLQNCMDIQYSNDKSQTEMNVENINRFLSEEIPNSATEIQSHNKSILFIYYKDSHYIPIRRIEVFGTADLLASLGGVMGLCMGISLLSVIEFFHWMLIRPCCQRIKQNNPMLRSIRKNYRKQNTDATVQYSKYTEEQR